MLRRYFKENLAKVVDLCFKHLTVRNNMNSKALKRKTFASEKKVKQRVHLFNVWVIHLLGFNKFVLNYIICNISLLKKYLKSIDLDNASECVEAQTLHK